ncbi:MAG: polyprenyl synthetase family protein [Acidobacteria bacterium]|nr:polyprenyl synthetase family protein [Acidobacteriota bacterium]
MSERLYAYISNHREKIEEALSDFLPVSTQPKAASLNDALRYALFPGGKRWRPVLTMLGAEVAGACSRDALPVACAMEYLHTSSIIFDDLPSMDDADVRRGRESLHVVYGESIALLTGLTLLNESYALLVRAARNNGFFEAATMLVEEAARCIGSNGMIGGQVVDLLLQGSGQGVDALHSKNLKTTSLMRLTMIAGAAACGADDGDVRALADYGDSLGLAYQICDDLLDELGHSDDLGKPAGQDLRHCRTNFVSELGIEEAHLKAVKLIEEGNHNLVARFGDCLAAGLIADASALILNNAGRHTAAAA